MTDELEIAVLHPMHPGEVLREEFMVPHGMSAGMVAKACRVPRTRIERIAREEMGVTADTALRLEKLFGSSAQFWLNLQSRYDMEIARLSIGAEIEEIERVAA